MKKILLPTDFSKNAWNAILYALELFKEEKCTFYLLNAYTPAFYRLDYMLGGPMASAIPDIGVDISLNGLESTSERIKNDHYNPRHTLEILSAFNTLPDEVNEVCQDRDIDLVVMGTQGATGAKEFFSGLQHRSRHQKITSARFGRSQWLRLQGHQKSVVAHGLLVKI